MITRLLWYEDYGEDRAVDDACDGDAGYYKHHHDRPQCKIIRKVWCNIRANVCRVLGALESRLKGNYFPMSTFLVDERLFSPIVSFSAK